MISAPSAESEDYVYDIYYEDHTTAKLILAPSPPPPRTRNAPPVIGRASAKPHSHAFSPVPLSSSQRTWTDSTSAPGFEHLAQQCNDESAWSEPLSWLPVQLRPSVDKDGQRAMVAIPIGAMGLHESDLVLENQTSPGYEEEEEDSNDEDYFGNEYPDRDEWDADSGEGSDF